MATVWPSKIFGITLMIQTLLAESTSGDHGK